MKVEFSHKELGEVFYLESVWTGRNKITLNGRELQKTGEDSFVTETGESVTIKESYFAGTVLSKGGTSVHLTQPIKWYDVLLSFLPLIFILIFGNIFKMVAEHAEMGVLLMAIFTLASVFCLFVIKEVLIGYKVLISIVTAGIDFLIYFYFAYCLVGAVFEGVGLYLQSNIVLGVLGGCLSVFDLLLVLLKEKKIWLIVLIVLIVSICICGIICGVYYGIEFANPLSE